MSTPFLPPPPTNQTLIVAEFTRHLADERLERRRRLPGVIARNLLLTTVLLVLFAGSIWVATRITPAIEDHFIRVRAQQQR
jgi:hypothetical protein